MLKRQTISPILDKIITENDIEGKNNTILYLNAMTIIASNAPDMILNLSNDELWMMTRYI